MNITKRLYSETNIQNIANAIRTKTGSNEVYQVRDMPQAILDIPTGGGGLNLTTSLNINSDKLIIYDSDKATISTILQANYDDLSPSDIDLKGYLKNATIKFVNTTFGDRYIGSAITDENGVAIFEITDECTIKAKFDGTSDYNPCQSEILNIYKFILPDEYQRVDYIQGTGTQYIELDYVLQAHDIVEGTVDIQDLNSQYGFIFGARRISVTYNCYGLFSKFGGYNRFNYARTRNEASGNIHELDTKYSFKTENNNCIIYKDNVIVDTITSSGTIENCINNCGVFCANTSSNNIQFSPDSINCMKLYNFKILSENNEYIRYLVPCYRKSDNVVGLYDLVTNTFYTNNGTGEFIIPPRIIYEDKCDNDNKLNHYETYNLLGIDGRATLTYNSNENAYELKPVTSTRDNWIGFTIDDMDNIDNYKCEIKFKAKLPITSYAYNQLLIGVVDYDTSDYYGCRVRSDKLYQMFLREYDQEYEQTIYTDSNRFANQYYKLIIEKDDMGIIYTLFDNNDNELGKFQQEIFLSNSFGFFMGVQMRDNGFDTRNFGFYIKDIIFTELE